MKPSPIVFTSEPPWAWQRLARDALVLAQDLARPASPRRCVIAVEPSMSVKRMV